MDIYYLGHSSFKIKTKTATIVTDPFLPSQIGLKFPKTEAELVTVSHQHQDHNSVSMVDGNPFVVSAPGEYEVKGVSIFGFPSFHDSESGSINGPNSIYIIEADGLRICHLGDLGSEIPANLLEDFGEIDILMIPVGGEVTLDPKEAVDLISKIEPSIVLPMHFKTEGINEEVFGKLATLSAFLKEAGVENPEKLDKLSITKDKLPEETKIILLERKS